MCSASPDQYPPLWFPSLFATDRFTHITHGVWWNKQRSYIEFIGLLLVRGLPFTKKEAICKLSIAYAIGILA